MTSSYIETDRHPIHDSQYERWCREEFNERGVLVLEGFFSEDTVVRVSSTLAPHEQTAFYTHSTHNVYLTLSTCPAFGTLT